ncbi:hypothetical protein MMC30_001814 [Trapelia coarctata]|nr:hypothetical protein [Trapelia coarctata]
MNSTVLADGSYAFSPNAVQTVLLAILCLCIMGVICSLTTRSLHKIILWFAPINSMAIRKQRHLRLVVDVPSVLASLGICVALVVMTPNKQSATWVFTNVTDGSGWGSKGFSFLLGHATTPRFFKFCH